MITAASSSDLTWRFVTYGGFEQLALQNADQLFSLDQIDPKLWAALACPTEGLHFDQPTLDYLDTDDDRRIRLPEILAAIRWTAALVKDREAMLSDPVEMPLAAIDQSSPVGAQLRSSAALVLSNLGKPQATTISPADTGNTNAIFSNPAFNGDGVISPGSTDDPELRSVLEDIIATMGPAIDCSGAQGVDRQRLDEFFDSLAAQLASRDRAHNEPELLPLGDATAAASDAIAIVEAKIDDFFVRCRLASFDPRAAAPLDGTEADFAKIADRMLVAELEEISALPLARVSSDGRLPLDHRLNPAWAARMELARELAFRPLLAITDEMDEPAWTTLKRKLAPYRAWQANSAGAAVASLSSDRMRAILDSDAKARIGSLIDGDLAESADVAAISDLDRLVRYYCHLNELLRNFLNFSDFYSPDRRAVFEAGTLYLDSRSCELCLFVDDPARHAPLGGLAGIYLAYCDLVRKNSQEKKKIVAAFTNGSSDFLMVGRNGLFIDRKGRDWDATVTRIVDNPISIREAFWAPYKKMVRFIDEQLAKRAAAADAATEAKLKGSVVGAVQPGARKQTKDSGPDAENPRKLSVGTVAALGVAFGAIGTFLAALIAYATGIARLGPLAVLGAFIGIVLLISGPSVLIAFLKLRKRTLGPLLDACGWAVNARAHITVPFGAKLTELPRLPPGSSRERRDPYADKRSRWPAVLVLVALLWAAYAFFDQSGQLHRWTHGYFGSPAKLTEPADSILP